MEYDIIKDLIYTIDNSGLTDFEMDLVGDIYIKMSKGATTVAPANSMPRAKAANAEPVIKATEVPAKEATAVKPTIIEEVSEPMTIIPEDKVEIKAGNIITSPMVGTFYAAASPDKPPFKKVGDKVASGDVVCVIEAMKIMNEIVSQYDGEVAEIFVENDTMVEYGQPLFRIV